MGMRETETEAERPGLRVRAPYLGMDVRMYLPEGRDEKNLAG